MDQHFSHKRTTPWPKAEFSRSLTSIDDALDEFFLGTDELLQKAAQYRSLAFQCNDPQKVNEYLGKEAEYLIKANSIDTEYQ